MPEMPCQHCGAPHAASAAFCPTTGAAMPAATDASPPKAPERGVYDLLVEAWGLYRKHARALLLTCAVLFVPAAVVKSCAVAAIMGPTLAAPALGSEAHDVLANDVEASRLALQDAYQRHADPATIDRLQAEQTRRAKEADRRGTLAMSAAMGSFTMSVLSMLGMLVTFFIYAVTIPLTNGALTIAVADRVTGGEADWRQVWQLLFRRLWPLLTAIVPAAFITAFGFVMLYVPGLVLVLLFTFASPAVLIEGLHGRAALRRSLDLVSGDWLRVAIMLIVLGVLRWAAQMVVGLFIPASWPFFGSLAGDLVTLVCLPLPVLGMVLLYFDVRRKREGFTDDRLRADLEALKQA